MEIPPFPEGTSPDVREVADWVEFAALAERKAFKRGDLKSAIAIESVEAPEVLEEATWHELTRRAEVMGRLWPLRLVGSRISQRSPSPIPRDFYRFFCLLGFRSVDQVDRTLFEVVVANVIAPLTGRPGLHVGAPASEGMDPSFRKRVAFYAAEAGLAPMEIKDEPLPHDKDLGLDAVTWLVFMDGRGAELHFMVQCATGADWDTKLHDIELEVWKDHIHWGVRPVRVFAVPFLLILPQSKWIRTSRKGGLILDRARLVELATRVTVPRHVADAVRTRVRTLRAA